VVNQGGVGMNIEQEEWDKYRNMIFDKDTQLTKAKEIIRALLKHTHGQNLSTQNDFDLYLGKIKEAERFLEATE
jgi:hypothetical protein